MIDDKQIGEDIIEKMKKIIAINETAIFVVYKSDERRLLPTKFRLSKREQVEKIEEEYAEFLKANNEFPVMKSGEDYLVYKNFNVDIDKLKFHAGEECCDLIVSCLTYLHTFFSKEERNKLIEHVNEKNIKRRYLEK